VNSKYILLRKQLLFCFVCSSFLALNGQSSKIIIPDWQTNLSTSISKKGYQSVALVVATNQLYRTKLNLLKNKICHLFH